MKSTTKTILVILTVFSMMLSGCTEATNDSIEDNDMGDEIDDTPLPNCELNNSCFEPEEQLVVVPHSDGCDNINPIHCMLPFPSDVFLVDDETKETGKRIGEKEKQRRPGRRRTGPVCTASQSGRCLRSSARLGSSASSSSLA